MKFESILKHFAAAVEAGDGQALGALFTPDGVYHDVFYGDFTGPQAIAGMLEALFHRDGEDFRWEMRDPVSDGRTGYARWLFSYTATSPQSRGRRVLMEGIGLFRLRDGLIESYEDYARIGEVLVQLGLPAEKTQKVLSKMAERQNAKPDAKPHLSEATDQTF